MRLFKLKISRLALIFAVVALALHLGIGYLLAAEIKNTTLAGIWQRSLKVYWPALDLIQLLRLNVNVSFVFGMATMLVAALLELWTIFAAGIWLLRIYFRKPPISNPNATNSGGRYPIDWAVTSGNLPVVKLLADKTSNNQSVTLFLAVQQQQVPVVKFLLEHGANPNIHYSACNSGTPLDLAAQQGNVEAARLLLEHGADVNGQAGGCGQINYTPLDAAIGGSSSEMVELLFANGAVILNKGSGYRTIFQEWALGVGDTNIANLLLSHKANINAKDSDGKTALHFAVQQGTFQAVEWLLKNGAEVNARDNKGVTPLSLTKFRNRGRVVEKRKDVADLLQKYGAKE